MEGKLLLDALLELLALLECQAVGLGNDGDNVDDIGKLLQDNDINRLERVARGLNEEKTAVDTGVLDVSFTLGGELLAEVGGVLVLDILDDGIPAAVVVNEIAVSGSVNNVKSEAHTVLLNNVGHGVDLGGGSDGLVGEHASLGVNEVRREHGVDESGLSETSLA